MRTSLILFDVDATLLRTDGAGMRCMIAAARDVLGPALRWDGIEPSGGIDPVLLAEAARRSGLRIRPGDLEAFRDRYVELLAEEFAHSREGVRALSGVPDLLDRLRERPETALGLLTGNFRETAILKLRAAGLDPERFSLGAFAEDADTRPGLVLVALRKFEELYGRPVDRSRVVLVGDTPRDVAAALATGCRVLGVATGKYAIEDLQAAGAHAAVRTLEDAGPLWRLLGADDDSGPRPPGAGGR